MSLPETSTFDTAREVLLLHGTIAQMKTHRVISHFSMVSIRAETLPYAACFPNSIAKAILSSQLQSNAHITLRLFLFFHFSPFSVLRGRCALLFAGFGWVLSDVVFLGLASTLLGIFCECVSSFATYVPTHAHTNEGALLLALLRRLALTC